MILFCMQNCVFFLNGMLWFMPIISKMVNFSVDYFFLKIGVNFATN